MRSVFSILVSALANLEPPANPRFRDPATVAEINRAQALLGVPFGEALIEFLLCANGQQTEGTADPFAFVGDPIVPMFRFGPEPVHRSAWGWFLGVEEILELTLWNREAAEDNRDEVYRCFGPARFHGGYIQLVGSSNPARIAIDLDPPEGGVYGQIVAINDQPNHVAVLSPGYREFIESIAEGYRTGRFRYSGGAWSE